MICRGRDLGTFQGFVLLMMVIKVALVLLTMLIHVEAVQARSQVDNDGDFDCDTTLSMMTICGSLLWLWWWWWLLLPMTTMLICGPLTAPTKHAPLLEPCCQWSYLWYSDSCYSRKEVALRIKSKRLSLPLKRLDSSRNSTFYLEDTFPFRLMFFERKFTFEKMSPFYTLTTLFKCYWGV